MVPRADEHQGEYVPRSAQRLAWLTGFTGSAGWAVVLRERAAIFIDGRYTLQVRQQVDTSAFEPIDYPANTPDQWLARTLRAGQRFGFDPWLHSSNEVDRLQKACDRSGATLVALDSNPLDAVWTVALARNVVAFGASRTVRRWGMRTRPCTGPGVLVPAVVSTVVSAVGPGVAGSH